MKKRRYPWTALVAISISSLYVDLLTAYVLGERPVLMVIGLVLVVAAVVLAWKAWG